MDLREARLCLDCEQIYEGPRCPVCASESFAFVSRWVPARERRTGQKRAASPEAATYRRLLVADAVKPKAMRLVKRGAIGLAAISLARWVWRQSGAHGTQPATGARGRRKAAERLERGGRPVIKDAAERKTS